MYIENGIVYDNEGVKRLDEKDLHKLKWHLVQRGEVRDETVGKYMGRMGSGTILSDVLTVWKTCGGECLLCQTELVA